MKSQIEDKGQMGLVLRAGTGLLEVQCGAEILSCRVRGRLGKKKQRRTRNLIVVGDRVRVSRQGDTVMIEEVLPRRNSFTRPGFRGVESTIAANVDQLVVVVSVGAPPFKRNIVDRFLVHANRDGMEPLLVVNKADLSSSEKVEEALEPVRSSGVSVVWTSAHQRRGVAELRDRLSGRLNVLVGQSGVGKSSLLNALLDLALETREVSVHQKGKHTTTRSFAYPLPGGGLIVDTPGIKSLGIWSPGEELDDVFPEIAERASGCRFGDCRHQREPDCAVVDAVEAGEIERARYRNYLRLAAVR